MIDIYEGSLNHLVCPPSSEQSKNFFRKKNASINFNSDLALNPSIHLIFVEFYYISDIRLEAKDIKMNKTHSLPVKNSDTGEDKQSHK